MTIDSSLTSQASNDLKPGWRTVRFDQMAENVNDRVDDPSEAGVEYYVGLEHLDPESLKIRRWGKPTDVEATKLRFQPGDIIFGRRRAYQRKLAVAKFEGICSAHALVLRARKDVVLPEFLPFFMQSDAFFERAMSISVGSLSPTINWKTLAAQEFALPPRDEQRRIAEILWAADEAVQKLESSLIATKQFQDTVLLTLLTKGVGNKSRPFKNSKFGQIPSHWRICPISDVAEVEYGISEAVSGNTDPSIGWPILTNANITLDGKLDLSKLNYIEVPKKDSFTLKKGDLLLVWRSGSPDHVGKTAIFDLEQPFTHASFLLRIRVGKEINNIFLHNLLNFMRRRELFKADTSQQVNFKMNASVFREIPVIVPPSDEQKEMLEVIVSMDRARDAIINRIDTSQKLQKQLVSQFLDGSNSGELSNVQRSQLRRKLHP